MGHKQAPKLPDEALHSIAGRLSSLVCFAAFRSVCKPWRSFFLQHYSFLVPPRPPWLMLPDPNSSDSLRPTIYGLYGFDEQKQFYQCKIPYNYAKFVGSSGTWLVYDDREAMKLRVWNPLSLLEISLPFVTSRENNTNVIVEKVTVSCTGPLIKNAIEEIVFGVVYNSKHFAWMRLGDKEWTTIEVDFFPSESTTCVNDLVFYKGKFFLVDQSGVVYVCEENVHVPRDHNHLYCHPIKAMKFIDHANISSWQKLRQDFSQNRVIKSSQVRAYKYYLVEFEGELMLVIQCHFYWYSGLEDDFRIFKLDFNRRKWKFINRCDMKGCSLFLNHCYRSMATKTVSGRSCIYFKTYEQVKKSQSDILNHKMQVFNYMSEPACAVLSKVTELHRHSTHPVWIIPTYTNDLKPRSCFNFLFHLIVIVGFLYLLLGYKYSY